MAFMGFVVILLFMMFDTSHAGQMYQCVDSNGGVSFQAHPCSAEQGKSKQVPIPSAPAVGWQQEVESQESRAQKQMRESIDRYNADSRQHYDQQIKQIDDRRCQYYRDQLTGAEERWAAARKQGYTQADRRFYEARINDRKRDVARECS